jgi:glycosyltransferase domain-containing protein
MREPDFVDECYADKDLSLLKKLTLVIPTYNRNYYLSRCLWYHAHFPFGEIIVADSSPEEKKVVNRETVAKVREMFGANVRYLEYEPETEKYGGDIYRKWGDAVQHVETEYSQIVTDKEFLIPDTLIIHIRYLEQNLDYIACFGSKEFLCFYNGKYHIRRKPYLYSIENTNPYQRYLTAIKSSPWAYSHLQSTMRSTIHKQTYNLLVKYDIADIRYGEIIIGYLPHIFGKMKYTKQHYLTRDLTAMSENVNKSESSTQRYPCFDEYEFSINAKYYNNYVSCVEHLLQKIGLSVNSDILRNDVPINLIMRYNEKVHSVRVKNGACFIKLYWLLPEIIQETLGRYIMIYFNVLPSIKMTDFYSMKNMMIYNIIEKNKDRQRLDKPVRYFEHMNT